MYSVRTRSGVYYIKNMQVHEIEVRSRLLARTRSRLTILLLPEFLGFLDGFLLGKLVPLKPGLGYWVPSDVIPNISDHVKQHSHFFVVPIATNSAPVKLHFIAVKQSPWSVSSMCFLIISSTLSKSMYIVLVMCFKPPLLPSSSHQIRHSFCQDQHHSSQINKD